MHQGDGLFLRHVAVVGYMRAAQPEQRDGFARATQDPVRHIAVGRRGTYGKAGGRGCRQLEEGAARIGYGVHWMISKREGD